VPALAIAVEQDDSVILARGQLEAGLAAPRPRHVQRRSRGPARDSANPGARSEVRRFRRDTL